VQNALMEFGRSEKRIGKTERKREIMRGDK
jgi:hypothetical protein